MLSKLFKFVFVGSFAATILLAFSMYSNGIRTVEDIQKKYSEATNVVSELLTDANINRPAKVELNIQDIQNKLNLTSTLKVANLSSNQLIKVKQTGSRDTWVIGGLLKGTAYFDIEASFNGSVEYETKDITFTKEGNTIVATLGLPKIYFGKIQYSSIRTAGNLNEIVKAKQNLLQSLDSQAQMYNYSLYLSADENKDLLTLTANKAEDSIMKLIKGVLDTNNPNNQYQVAVKSTSTSVDTITIQNGNTSTIVPLKTVLESIPDPIIQHISDVNNGVIELNLQKVDNVTKLID